MTNKKDSLKHGNTLSYVDANGNLTETHFEKYYLADWYWILLMIANFTILMKLLVIAKVLPSTAYLVQMI